MNKSYLLEYGCITEFTYEKEAPKMFTGCAKTRDVCGKRYYLPTKIHKRDCVSTATEALTLKKERVERNIEIYQLSIASSVKELDKITKLMETEQQ